MYPHEYIKTGEQVHFARRAKLDPAAVSRIVNGKSWPSAATARAFHRASEGKIDRFLIPGLKRAGRGR